MNTGARPEGGPRALRIQGRQGGYPSRTTLATRSIDRRLRSQESVGSGFMSTADEHLGPVAMKLTGAGTLASLLRKAPSGDGAFLLWRLQAGLGARGTDGAGYRCSGSGGRARSRIVLIAARRELVVVAGQRLAAHLARHVVGIIRPVKPVLQRSARRFGKTFAPEVNVAVPRSTHRSERG